MPAGLHVEVTASGQFLRPVLAFCIRQRDEIFPIGGMDEDHLASIRRDSGAGGLSPGRSEGYGIPPSERATTDATLGGEESKATGKGKVASPIAHSRPNFPFDDEILWRLAGRSLPGEHSLPGSAFPPYEGVVSGVPEHVAQAEGIGSVLRRQWTRPVPEGCCLRSTSHRIHKPACLG